LRRVSLFLAVITLAALPLLARGETVGTHSDLPKPYSTEPAKKFVNISGWPAGAKPSAPKGFMVTKFAGDLDNPRWLYVLPNGDVLVSGDRTGSWHNEPNRITLLRDADGDGIAEKRSTFLKGLDKPFGMALLNGKLYVGEQGAVLRYPYQDGETEMTAEGEKILDLPTGGYNYHFTRNLLFSKDGKKLYVSVGSASNAGEGGMDSEKRRARILEVNPDGSGERTYGFGLRNPVGMDWEPSTGKLWCVVNERDNLGDDLVPDFLTSVTPGGFYGWPLFYFGDHRDPRWNGEPPEWAKHALTPDYALGSHVAPLGLAFYTASQFPEKYRNGAFVAEHGSWNRSSFVGYKVVFIPFKNGKPAGQPEDFLTGFLHDAVKNIGYGRPVGIAIAKDGGLLVADDAGGVVWKVSVAK
jgi:glucose/arabinose dehydrogenase